MMYESLDVSKMWTLSTGKIVEKQMALFASSCIYEHLAHSLILDVSDSIWTEYFTTEEIKEIMNTNRTTLPSLPEDLSNYINSFDKEFVKPLDLYYQAHSNVFHPFQEKDKKWVQQICSSAADLYLYKVLDNYNTLESKVKHRVWNFLYTVFDGSKVKVEIGEKSSVASAIRRNSERRLEGQEMRRRKNMDMLFFYDDCELGCTEVGKNSVGVDDDKYMGDGMLKLPKAMKDMLCMASKVCLSHLRDFRMIGYIIMEVVMLDSPVGYVSRIVRTDVFKYPKNINSFSVDIIPIIEIIWKTKVVMETTMKAIENRQKKVADFYFALPTPTIPPCFNRSDVKTPQKRKFED
ncbi:uncharacterized protein BX663DRAFT_864 [Cokeromyces recurvatus]|uniref:uncharacterized protein n=1 Tax=Cokeromyces recurvatus TaxID=90255 RepID=UPI00221E89CE|nr:uncharacterized protein BX663DRAFT_864 [Cokeromyces recurvatus]KAI7907456.1 hypothetical protein BX663DRAFT_864 [Cokeromyces recurvatus]